MMDGSKTSPGRSTALGAHASRAPAARSETKKVGKGRTRDGEPREMGIALALLKYFYWIEIGIRSYLRTRDNLEFSRSEGLLIATIMLGYTRPSEIARQLGLSRQAIHATIQQMRKKGIVDLVPDPDDGRIKQVVLTMLAKKMNEDGIVAMDFLWRELGRRVGHADLNRLAEILRKDWGPPVIFDSDDRSLGSWAP